MRIFRNPLVGDGPRMTAVCRAQLAPRATEPARDNDETVDDESLCLVHSSDIAELPAIATTHGQLAGIPRCNTGLTDVLGGTDTRTLSTDSVVSAHCD